MSQQDVAARFQGHWEHHITSQQDTTPPHTVQGLFHENDIIGVLPWPPVSPDLSHIDNVWDEMECRLRLLPQQLSNVLRLLDDIQQRFHFNIQIGANRLQ